MRTPDTPPAFENTRFQSQYVIRRKGSGFGIEMSREKKKYILFFKEFAISLSKMHKFSCSNIFEIRKFENKFYALLKLIQK